MKLLATENILEIAVHSFQSALAAEEGGADRIELCTALQTGGLSPDPGLLNLVMESISLPVHVLIRPRLGDFVYDSYEFKTMLRMVEICRDSNVVGVVIGCLTRDGLIHSDQIRKIKEVSGDLDLTFHRAIDVCTNVLEALDLLRDVGFDRVLTSGQSVTAWQGRKVISKMVEHIAGSQLVIMPGAGVNATNIAQILSETGCREIHGSAKGEYSLSNFDNIGLTYINNLPVLTKWESQKNEIRQMKKAIS
ncbi:MAG: copper homeostasis protein CutC [Saprospiraceae bacterium]|nr:copper homeostasis protein CutC [Saprospiraceae bacterium]